MLTIFPPKTLMHFFTSTPSIIKTYNSSITINISYILMWSSVMNPRPRPRRPPQDPHDPCHDLHLLTPFPNPSSTDLTPSHTKAVMVFSCKWHYSFQYHNI